MIFKQMKVGKMDNFAYIIGDEETKEGAVVDPGWDVDRILATARDLGLQIRYVINTHSHYDHILGNEEVVKRTGAKVISHESAELKKDIGVKDGDTISIGWKLKIQVIHTPGHCPDHICLLMQGKVLTGDTLFVGECGRIDLPGGNSEELYDSLFNKLMKLSDEIEVYPGHDYGVTPSSTIGYERKNNYVLVPRSKREFVDFMSS